MNKDTLLVNLSDFQTGSSTALFVNRFWEGLHQNHTPTKMQEQIYKHFLDCADLLVNRGNRNIVLVNSGDSIDGNHHDTHQLITRVIGEQIDVHEELMNEFLERCKFSRSNGDRLIYIQGTETHTGESEAKIAADLGAEFADYFDIHIHGKNCWFVHHGGRAGKGPNKGNSLRNTLRDVYYDCLEEGESIPDLISFAHVHTPIRDSFEGKLKRIIGYINPSWQMKTRFGYRVAPLARTALGMTVTEITSSGIIGVPYFHLMKVDFPKTVIIDNDLRQV